MTKTAPLTTMISLNWYEALEILCYATRVKYFGHAPEWNGDFTKSKIITRRFSEISLCTTDIEFNYVHNRHRVQLCDSYLDKILTSCFIIKGSLRLDKLIILLLVFHCLPTSIERWHCLSWKFLIFASLINSPHKSRESQFEPLNIVCSTFGLVCIYRNFCCFVCAASQHMLKVY